MAVWFDTASPESKEHFFTIVECSEEEARRAVVSGDMTKLRDEWVVLTLKNESVCKFGKLVLPSGGSTSQLQVQSIFHMLSQEEYEKEWHGRMVYWIDDLELRGIVISRSGDTLRVQVKDRIIMGDYMDWVFSNNQVITTTYAEELEYRKIYMDLQSKSGGYPRIASILKLWPWLEKFDFEITDNFPAIIEVKIVGVR